MITESQLKKIMPFASVSKIALFTNPLNKAMDVYGIDTPIRKAAFLAQIGHESGSLAYVKELASGKAYEGRKDLGNNTPGDGVKYKGRGLIQITGKHNYTVLVKAFDIDLINYPELLEQPEYAAKSAAWFWNEHKLNNLADKDEFTKITKVINGGTNGLADRLSFYGRAKKVLLG